MAVLEKKQAILDFNVYPDVGEDDWRYAFSTARIRAMETQLIGRGLLIDMINSSGFEQALELITTGEYSALQGKKSISEVEEVLLGYRSEVRELFRDLMIDKEIVELLAVREDFRNMRLALRRKLTDRELGVDYSGDGSIAAEEFGVIFETEDYSPLPAHMQEAIECAVLAYYQKKDIRQIDYALDSMLTEYRINRAIELGNKFLLEFFRMRIDLTNITTMLRLKFLERDERGVFLSGGYVEETLLGYCIDSGYETIAGLFYATPYYEVIDSGVNYLNSKGSFLRLEHACWEHISGYLHSTSCITSGPQPIIAYFLLKEAEIRNVRLILTAKKNNLDKRLIHDKFVG